MVTCSLCPWLTATFISYITTFPECLERFVFELPHSWRRHLNIHTTIILLSTRGVSSNIVYVLNAMWKENNNRLVNTAAGSGVFSLKSISPLKSIYFFISFFFNAITFEEDKGERMKTFPFCFVVKLGKWSSRGSLS